MANDEYPLNFTLKLLVYVQIDNSQTSVEAGIFWRICDTSRAECDWIFIFTE